NIETVQKHADTNDDFCGEGYYDAPAPLVEQLEMARRMIDSRNFNKAIQLLEDLLAGKIEMAVSTNNPDGEPSTSRTGGETALSQVPKAYVRLVQKSLAYCLGCRAAHRMNEAIDEWDAYDTSVITAIEIRVDLITSTSWQCAKAETIEPGQRCPCMACSSIITSRYSVLKWTFNKDKGPASLIICGTCADKHHNELDTGRNAFKAGVRPSAQDYVDAGQLDPSNKFVQGQITRMQKRCVDLELPMPSPQKRKIKAGPSLTEGTANVASIKKWWQFWK
ncbi:MAG: hypothetical protein ACREIC_05505, partial [Limisphaerales bacterium]